MSTLPEFEISAAHALARLQATLAFMTRQTIKSSAAIALVRSISSALNRRRRIAG